ncbi:ORF-92 [Agrotis segetum nucleopolyhedrovirus A]|uniref:ORF-92 n=1 Tax=Agrotis segetum nuclear polyhedrosis virus TaxID=1962501 RepID=Q287I0_NPVAS|nr:ORF-92 [Agrotis segetum nucleopolyhedrovirus A]AAZ38258.1 ORF-92 [Agrotis segetum nucleopolyhedrovirus A]
MSLDVPYERLGPATKVDYIPLKLALDDLPDTDNAAKNKNNNNNNNNNNNDDTNSFRASPKVDIAVDKWTAQRESEAPSEKQQMYDALVVGMLTFFCILVLLYAIYYFVILRDRQKSIIQPSYMI